VKLTIDIETNLAHDRIWGCAYYADDVGGWCTNAGELQTLINSAEVVIGHNIIGFDVPVLERVWGIYFDKDKVCDTMIMSSLHKPEERHSLELVAIRYNKHYFKSEFDVDDFDAGTSDEMISYAIDDVMATSEAYDNLKDALKKDDFSETSIVLEHKFKWLICEQERNGFMFDMEKANQLYSELCLRTEEINRQLQLVFPPIVTQRWSEKTGKRLKDNIEVFNPNSRQQIAKRLRNLGVKFKRKTEKGNIIVDEKVLAGIDLPEAQLLNESLLLKKRMGLLDGWFKAYNENTGRIHGRVRTNGAVSGRCTHSNPNLAQVPAVRSPYGGRCRELFTVPDGYSLVGIDASGLELRMLAHYMDDDEYTRVLLEDDIHTKNQEAFGCDTRDQAKTLIYAMLYGAGDAKLGSIVGGNATDGAKLRESFLNAVPSYSVLLTYIKTLARGGSLLGLDGRRLWIRHEHAALNLFLQGAGAIVMKQALIEAAKLWLAYALDYKLVANVHDEWQVEALTDHAETVGQIGVEGIQLAGIHFNMRLPLDGEFKVGSNWKETH
jgi:DNA polymerase-1